MTDNKSNMPPTMEAAAELVGDAIGVVLDEAAERLSLILSTKDATERAIRSAVRAAEDEAAGARRKITKAMKEPSAAARLAEVIVKARQRADAMRARKAAADAQLARIKANVEATGQAIAAADEVLARADAASTRTITAKGSVDGWVGATLDEARALIADSRRKKDAAVSKGGEDEGALNDALRDAYSDARAGQKAADKARQRAEDELREHEDAQAAELEETGAPPAPPAVEAAPAVETNVIAAAGTRIMADVDAAQADIRNTDAQIKERRARIIGVKVPDVDALPPKYIKRAADEAAIKKAMIEIGYDAVPGAKPVLRVS